MTLKVLSLFDGISCGQLALQRANIPYSAYYASEIDEYAIAVTQKNFPDTLQLSDASWLPMDFLKGIGIDLVIGGSPCQGFSKAGKRKMLDDDRSKLIFRFIEVVKELKPKYFLLENVKIKDEIAEQINTALGVKAVKINSNLLSAQNRSRLYWTNIPFDMPTDKGIRLQDIIEKNLPHNNSLDKLQWIKDSTKELPSIPVVLQKPRGVGKGGWKALNGKTPALTISFWQNNNILYLPDGTVRKFTPVEYERLQTIPDNYTDIHTTYRRYSLIGNAWTVDVVAHILKGIR